MEIAGDAYHATREEMTQRRVFAIPEEPLKNACVANMSVAQNLALRDFDRAPLRRGGWRLDRRAMRERAAHLIDDFTSVRRCPNALSARCRAATSGARSS